MNELTRYIAGQFREPAGIGGWAIGKIQNAVNRRMYQAAIELVRPNAGDRILDIGCGNGHLLDILCRRSSAELYGIDISKDAIKAAARRNRNAISTGRMHLTTGDCCVLPYKACMFTTAVSINTVYFWKNAVDGLKEIKRVLKDEGSFCNIVYTKSYLDTIRYTRIGYNIYTPGELTCFGKAAGFRDIEVRDIVKGESYAVVYR